MSSAFNQSRFKIKYIKIGRDTQRIKLFCNKIKPYIEKSVEWIEIEILYGDKKNSNFDSLPYDSVGLCLYSYKVI